MSGTSGSRLDQIVKGAAPLGTSAPAVAATTRTPSPAPSLNDVDPRSPIVTRRTSSSSDPLATTLPSSPPQIYLNLLILEASLRSQYLTLRDRRRQNTFFLLLLGLWSSFFFYALFLQPREDGNGIGGSIYWVVEMGQKVALMGGVVTGILIWGTGQWERGVRWPRRFIGVANRGLRTMNCKAIVIKGPWWKETVGHLAFLFPYKSLFPSYCSSYNYNAEKRTGKHTENETDTVNGEDLAPGGDYIKLLLLPKPFSPDFRENWELYRREYWEKENERRAILLHQLKQRETQRAMEEGGWLWWTGRWGLKRKSAKEAERDPKRPPAKRGEPNSRNGSRSSKEGDDRPSSRGSQRGSGMPTEARKRSTRTSFHSQQVSKLTSVSSRTTHPPPTRATSHPSNNSETLAD